MANDKKVEYFYDVLDHSINLLYLVKHDNFFDLLIQTGKNIIAGEVLDPACPDDIKEKVMDNYNKLEGIDFNAEDIRRAFQMMSLRAFKESNLKLGEVTPDTIGIFIAYLILKLRPERKSFNILDPVVGTGNLLYSVANCIDADLKLYGIDSVREVLEISNVLGNLLNYDIEMFNQDTLMHPFSDMDIVLCDLPSYFDDLYDNIYFPYLCILEHLDSLKEDGLMFAIVSNDFFSYDEKNFFKDKLKEKGTIIGIIQLPLNMFKDNPKTLYIFTREKTNNKCLVVDLPSLDDVEKVTKSLAEIENWFLANYKKEGE